MKVIHAGREQKGWSIEATCTGAGNKGGGCGAVLLVEYGDVFHTYQSYGGRDDTYFATFECAACGVMTDLKEFPGRANAFPSYTDWKQDQLAAAVKAQVEK